MKNSGRLRSIFWLTGLMGCTEASQPTLNHQVEIEGVPSYLEVAHGTELTLTFKIKALDGLSTSKIIQDRLEKEVIQYRGEKESSGKYSLIAEITDRGDWEPSLKDTIDVVFFARDVDGDSQFKRVLIKVLAP